MGTDFSERLKAARELRKMSQTELAAKAILPATSISHFEAGSRKPSFENLRRLAVALEVSTDYLLGLVNHAGISEAADPLYRHSQNLSARDRSLAADFLRLLANKEKESDEEQ